MFVVALKCVFSGEYSAGPSAGTRCDYALEFGLSAPEYLAIGAIRWLFSFWDSYCCGRLLRVLCVFSACARGEQEREGDCRGF